MFEFFSRLLKQILLFFQVSKENFPICLRIVFFAHTVGGVLLPRQGRGSLCETLGCPVDHVLTFRLDHSNKDKSIFELDSQNASGTTKLLDPNRFAFVRYMVATKDASEGLEKSNACACDQRAASGLLFNTSDGLFGVPTLELRIVPYIVSFKQQRV